ncbi:hypothetical protein H6G27_24140 [Nostoc linckia FACHB-104]|nr:hypothetical protein [Nostoc linckia FACHB-104]
MNTTIEDIKQQLTCFTGTTRYYRFSQLFAYLLLTDGTKYLAEACKCYWLIEEIAVLQIHPHIYHHPTLQMIQFWTLVVRKDSTATLWCEWDEGKTVYTKEISYTTFPFAKIRLWVQPFSYSKDGKREWVIHLPSEY